MRPPSRPARLRRASPRQRDELRGWRLDVSGSVVRDLGSALSGRPAPARRCRCRRSSPAVHSSRHRRGSRPRTRAAAPSGRKRSTAGRRELAHSPRVELTSRRTARCRDCAPSASGSAVEAASARKRRATSPSRAAAARRSRPSSASTDPTWPARSRRPCSTSSAPGSSETDRADGAGAGSFRVARAGLEPATPRFSAVCSTN